VFPVNNITNDNTDKLTVKAQNKNVVYPWSY